MKSHPVQTLPREILSEWPQFSLRRQKSSVDVSPGMCLQYVRQWKKNSNTDSLLLLCVSGGGGSDCRSRCGDHVEIAVSVGKPGKDRNQVEMNG